jgi:hypothetical protein
MLFKEITYKNHIYKIGYANTVCKDSLGTIKHIVILIRVDGKSIPNVEYEWSDTCDNRKDIISITYDLIKKYAFRNNIGEVIIESTTPKPIEDKEISHINEFEKWNGNLDELICI